MSAVLEGLDSVVFVGYGDGLRVSTFDGLRVSTIWVFDRAGYVYGAPERKLVRRVVSVDTGRLGELGVVRGVMSGQLSLAGKTGLLSVAPERLEHLGGTCLTGNMSALSSGGENGAGRQRDVGLGSTILSLVQRFCSSCNPALTSRVLLGRRRVGLSGRAVEG